MKNGFDAGVRVRARGGSETGKIVRYDGELFYVVAVDREGETVELVVHEDDLEVA